MKFLFDENLSPQHAERLKTLGFDAISVLEAGLSGAPDERIRQFAIEDDRILVTLDADFAGKSDISLLPARSARQTTPASKGKVPAMAQAPRHTPRK